MQRLKMQCAVHDNIYEQKQTHLQQTASHSHRIIYYYCTLSISMDLCLLMKVCLKDLLPSLEFDRIAPLCQWLFNSIQHIVVVIVFVVHFIARINRANGLNVEILYMNSKTSSVHSLNCK